MNTRLVNYLLPCGLALFFMYGCSKDEDIEAACITSPPTEGFAGETVTLQSCNQNMKAYYWDISGPSGTADRQLNGQTVDLVLPADPGQYKITLNIMNSKAFNTKSFNITVKASGSLITEKPNARMQSLEAFQQPNGNFIVFGTYNPPGEGFIQYKWILSNKLQKLSSSPAKELGRSNFSYYNDLKSLVTPIGVLLCGYDAAFGSTDSYLLNPDGETIGNKNDFPSNISRRENYPIVLINDFRNGSILGESFKNVSSKNESYIHNALGLTVSWTTKIAHTDNTALRAITRGNNQYVILSIDSKLGSSFLDVLDFSGKIVDQKELKLKSSGTANDFIPNGGKILFSDNKFVLAVLNGSQTNVYWLDQNFTVEKSVTIYEPVVEAIHKTSSGYILFGRNFQVARLDNQGNLLSLGFNDRFGDLYSVIAESDGNFVLVGTSTRGNSSYELTMKIKAIRISPEGKVVQ